MKTLLPVVFDLRMLLPLRTELLPVRCTVQ
jgi:hypothetical protein